MLVLLPLLLAPVFLVSAAPMPITSQSDMLLADLHSTGQMLTLLIRKNSEFRHFAQQGLPIILDYEKTRQQKTDALLKSYDEFGPGGNFTAEEKANHVEKAISTIEAAKQQRIDQYFSKNLDEGNKFVKEIGQLFVRDEYIDGNDQKTREMLKDIIKKYEQFLSS